MSQSPLARSTRRTLPAFSHHPSRLSKSSTAPSLSELANSPSPSKPQLDNTTPTSTSTPSSTPSSASASASVSASRRDSTPTRYRDTSTATSSTTPVTPKILYSPYANNSPHAGPSRSASIPFDMAASAKAARRSNLENKGKPPVMLISDIADEGSGSAPIKSKRFVRRKSLWQRITALPEALIDRFIFDVPTSILDVLPATHLANPIALAIHIVHYLLLAPLLTARDDDYNVLRTGRDRTGVSGRWDKYEETGRSRGRSIAGGWFTFLFTLLLFVIALSNTTYLFTRFKTYDMQLRSAKDPLRSPHASPVPAPKPSRTNSTSTDDDVFSATPASISPDGTARSNASEMTSLKIAKKIGHIVFVFLRFLYHATLSAIGKPALNSSSPTMGNDGASEDKIQSLRVWEPPEFCLAFFCAFPPTAPVLSYLLNVPHPFLTPLIHLSSTLTLAHLATSYAQLVKDRMFLSAEVMREYDQRFVYKRVFASRVDRGTQTHEAEMIW